MSLVRARKSAQQPQRTEAVPVFVIGEKILPVTEDLANTINLNKS